MIKTVVRAHHWGPEKIESLYLDDADFFGLEYWYNDTLDHINQINKKE